MGDRKVKGKNDDKTKRKENIKTTGNGEDSTPLQSVHSAKGAV